MRFHLLWALLASIFVATLPFGSASAQATRTWVSGVGDDANPCSRTAPCKTFAGAISKTATAGEINCIDPGGFGALTITKAISIICDNTEAGVLVSGTNGITINVPANTVVYLRGLDIQGIGTGIVGVSIVQSGTVFIDKSIIRGFAAGAAYGVQLVSTAAPTKLVITDTTISDNGTGTTGGGIDIAPGAGGNANVNLKRVHLLNNVAGLVADGTSNTSINNVTIEDSEIFGSSNTGVLAISSGSGSPVKVMIDNCVLMANAPVALTTNGTAAFPAAGSAVIRIGNSVVTANPLSQSVVGQGQVLSYKNNFVDGNANDATPIPQVNLN